MHRISHARWLPVRPMALAVSLLFAVAAHAQVENQVQINTLTSAQAGGCYPGTAGTDSTMFVRASPAFVGCDTQDINPNFCLARREFAGDGANGAIVSFSDMALLRPGVTGDGDVVFFVNNLDLCVMASNQTQQDACYGLPSSTFVHGIAVEPQGNEIAAIPRDLFNISNPANAIQIAQVGTFPTLTLLNSFSLISPTIYPETLDFMTRGSWIVFDASSSPTTGGAWGLYLIHRNTGQVLTLAPPVLGYELRNPVFGQTSDDVIAFDAVSTTTGFATVLTADLLTGAVRKIADLSTSAGVPSFNGDDTKLVFTREDATVFSGASLRERALAADRITPAGPEQAHLSDGGYGTVYRRGTLDDTATPCPEPSAGLGLAASAAFLWLLRRRSARTSPE